MSQRVLVILAQGNEEIEALTPVDIMRRAGMDVVVAGLGGRTVASARNVVVFADVSFDAVTGDFDAVVLPGGNPGASNLCASDKVIEIVKKQFEAERLIAAICAAPTVLDKAGILPNRKYTCFPGVEKKISTGTFVGGEVVVDSNIITGRAMGSAIVFSLAIVEKLRGRAEADRVAEAIVFRQK